MMMDDVFFQAKMNSPNSGPGVDFVCWDSLSVLSKGLATNLFILFPFRKSIFKRRWGMSFTQLLNWEKHSGCAVHAYLYGFTGLSSSLFHITFQLGIHWLHFSLSACLFSYSGAVSLYTDTQILPFNVVFPFLSPLSSLLILRIFLYQFFLSQLRSILLLNCCFLNFVTSRRIHNNARVSMNPLLKLIRAKGGEDTKLVRIFNFIF